MGGLAGTERWPFPIRGFSPRKSPTIRREKRGGVLIHV